MFLAFLASFIFSLPVWPGDTSSAMELEQLTTKWTLNGANWSYGNNVELSHVFFAAMNPFTASMDS